MEVVEIIRGGPDPGSLTHGVARGMNVVYPTDYSGPIPLKDDAEVAFIFGVPFPADYARENLLEKASELMVEYLQEESARSGGDED